MTHEMQQRELMVELAQSMFNRGLTGGSSGNLSIKLDDGTFLATPTNSSFGFLTADKLSKINDKGELLSGEPASKEVSMHLAYYDKRPDVKAIIHLHSTYLTAYSTLSNLNPSDCLPPITPYFPMRIGKLPLVPYIRPGSPLIAKEVGKLAENHQAILLANHGSIIVGKNLRDAMYNAEELEESAKLFFLVQPLKHNQLSQEQLDELNVTFPKFK